MKQFGIISFIIITISTIVTIYFGCNWTAQSETELLIDNFLLMAMLINIITMNKRLKNKL